MSYRGRTTRGNSDRHSSYNGGTHHRTEDTTGHCLNRNEERDSERGRGRTPTNHERGRIPTNHERGKTPTNHERGRTPTNHERGRTPANHERGRTPTNHERGRTPANHERGRTPANHVRGRPRGQRGYRGVRGQGLSRASMVKEFKIENENYLTSDVISFGTNHRIMYIMRGLPGSGKSTLAQEIKSSHPEGIVGICSADDFRFNADGRYVWDHKTLHMTHQKCQAMALQFLRQGKHVVIIDNTNIHSKDYQPYLTMASEHGYPVVFLTFTTRDINFLTRNTIHGVSSDKIREMSLSFSDAIVPYFYAWSLPVAESSKIRVNMQNMLVKCETEVSSFRHILNRVFRSTANGIYTTYSSTLASLKECHVTVAFLDHDGKVPGSIRYNNQQVVRAAVGSVSDLKIIGWCITPRSFFCRIRLTNEQRRLWARDDSLLGDKSELAFESSPTLNGTVDKLLSQLTLNERQRKFTLPKGYNKPAHGIGSTAHLTLGTQSPFRPVTAKEDLYNVVHLEAYTDPFEEHQLGNILLRKYQTNVWVAYLKRPKTTSAIFSGHYKH